MSPTASPLIFGAIPRRLPRRRLRQLAGEIGDKVAPGRSFQCLLTNDLELRRLNRQFLGKDYSTDVLSFPAAPNLAGDAAQDSLGDLAISVERAREQAREQGHPLADEIGVLILHGLLHLLGMDHERDHGKMARAETRWRKRLGLPQGVIERVRP